MPRGTLAGQLAAMGFADTDRARLLLTDDLGLDPEGRDAPLVEALAAAADPDLALAALARISPGDELRAALRSDEGLRDRLVTVLGVSAALGDHLARHRDDWRLLAGPSGLARPGPGELRAALLAAAQPAAPPARQASATQAGATEAPVPQASVTEAGATEAPVPQASVTEASAAEAGAPGADAAGADAAGVGAAPANAVRTDTAGDAATRLRVAYRRRLLHLAARDLTGADPLDSVMAELADLATAALAAALAIATAGQPPGSAAAQSGGTAPSQSGGPAPSQPGGSAPSQPGGSMAAQSGGSAPGQSGGAAIGQPAGATARSAGAAPGETFSAAAPQAGGAGHGGLAVIAMGKTGGGELNYASDVDVIFVADSSDPAALRSATALASGMIRICSQAAPEGALFPVDPNLRPEGRDGPLVRTVASHRAYYERWAKTWEFQALLKARAAAGDEALAGDYLAAVGPLVWEAAQRPGFVADVQAMRRRVLGSLPADEAGRELKLGPGGLRDIEFAVQLLQLVHGRSDESLRVPGTLAGLRALAAGGYVGRADAAPLAEAYEFLRRVEHLLQLRQLRRTHTLPEDQAVLRQVGRAMRRLQPPPPADNSNKRGAGRVATLRGRAPQDPAQELIDQWRRHAAEARQLHEKLFYRPLLDAVARLPGAVRLTPEAATQRLEALGYVDPAGALRHIESLSSGVARKAAIQRTLLPVLLGWFADAPQPDAGLLAFRQVSEALGDSPWYLRLLRDNTLVAQRMARVLASSRYATGLLLRAPEAVAMLADEAELAPRPAGALLEEALAAVGRHEIAADAVGVVLAYRRRELLRTAMAYVLGLAGVADRGEALTTVAEVTVAAALRAAVAEAERAGGPLPTRIAVISMGRLGGREMGFASDADVLFVHDPLPGADEEAASRAAHSVAESLRALLITPRPDPALAVDAGLRPEGRQGPLVRTLASYRAYYRRWSVPWEAQALLRAGAVIGDQEVGAGFLALADELRYPDGGIGEDAVREIRRIKARMEAERMPRGMDPALNLKLGPGGLADVEWVAQLLQLRHAHAVSELRTTATIAALRAARAAGLASEADVTALTAAWELAARIRDGVMLMRGRGSDALPSAATELAVVARLLGYPPDGAQQLAEDWRRASRQARAVAERLFYG